MENITAELGKEYILKIYKEHLALAQDENVERELSDKELHNLAVEWTVEDVSSTVASALDSYWWERQDQINKDFYE